MLDEQELGDYIDSQLARDQVRFGLFDVHYHDHRLVVSPQRTSVVYHAPVRQGPTRVG